MVLLDVLVGISRFGPAKTQFGFYRLTKNVLFKHIYRYLQVAHARARARARACVCVCVCVCVYVCVIET